MKNENLSNLREAWSEWKSLFDKSPEKIINSVAVLSPSYGELKLLKELFDGDVVVLNKNDWDLNYENNNQYDLIVCSNIFVYSNDPTLWFSNVLKSCKFLWIYDIAAGKNGIGLEYFSEGEKCRFKLNPWFNSDYSDAYDLEQINLTNRFVDIRTHSCDNLLYFCAAIRGNR